MFTLYGPEYEENLEGCLGCMSYGFPDTPVETSECKNALEDIKMESFQGSYSEALSFAKKYSDAKAAIVVTNNKGGENVFLKELSAILSCPIVGGGAAIGSNENVPSIPDMSAQIQVHLIVDPEVYAEAYFENIHDEIIMECDLEFTDARVLEKVNGEDAVEFLKREKEKRNLLESDFEHLTFSTMENINAHLNKNDGIHIASGRDLEHKMLLRYVAPENVQERMEAFYDDKNAMVFGCAGLRGIMEKRHKASCFGGYFFGEICYVNGHGDFGNLMLSKLYIKRVAE